MQNPDKKRYDEGVAKLLPSPISEIKVQKKNTYRFSLFVENQFLVGVSDSTLTRFGLKKGTLLTTSLLHEVLQKEDVWAIKEYCIRLLGRRDHARNELRDKARKKGFPSHSIEEVLDELTKKKYINNAFFASKFAHDKFEFNKWGPNKIRAELFRRGISERNIDVALKEISTDKRSLAIKELIKKNKRKFERVDTSKRKKKIFDFLLRKGFQPSEILSQIENIRK
ncbi:MAG: regulatory protein RecX [Balneolaceae bacterium]|nr:regulatory protein RecX [Balneolaceae bacterium]MBO6547637.1 regulatory protein RecX [Balneolaceae bacterium]MBO6648148.1 regulatory protein RecX [Balneolaceae bacterium]